MQHVRVHSANGPIPYQLRLLKQHVARVATICACSRLAISVRNLFHLNTKDGISEVYATSCGTGTYGTA